MPKNVTNVAKSLKVFIFTAPLGEKCNAVLHVMHYIFGSKCTAILSNAVQFSKCTATCNALHSTSLVQYSDVKEIKIKLLIQWLSILYDSLIRMLTHANGGFQFVFFAN